MENLKTKIKEEFYQKRLMAEFESLWRSQITNGQVMRREKLFDHCVLSTEYKNILVELLEETGYFKEIDKQDAEIINGVGSEGSVKISDK